MAATTGAILITGCSTGIGRAAAERLAKRGHNVYATARRIEAIDDLRAAGCKTLVLDVCDDASMSKAVDTIVAEEGAVHALVNNAGYGQDGPIEEIPMDVLRRQFETNVFGLVRMTQLVLPGMRERRTGRIVNVSSMGGKLVFPGGGAYHATKFAVEALSDALRFELRPFGIHVSVIEPGAIRTNFEETSLATVPDHQGDGSPYAALKRAVDARYRATYRGRAAVGPQIVARAIEHAITSKRPRTRYPLTPGARTLLLLRRILPDQGWDALMRSQFR
jgi:NAD(P)-dependent dehydrogenase (short-subunit alcohol dehydrogenase family)